MKKMNMLKTVAITLLLSSPVWAGTDNQENVQPETPMMSEGGNSSMMESHMGNMNTATGDQKKEHKKHHDNPKTGEESSGMMMNSHMMKMMMGHHENQNMSNMEGGMGGNMANPEMMQQRKKHMSRMEQSLANIETLLEKLVEIQKP